MLLRCSKFARRPIDVVVVNKIVQNAPRIHTVFAVVFPVEVIGKFIHILTVQARPQGFINLVVCYRIKPAVHEPFRIIAVNDFAHQPKIRFNAPAKRAQRVEKIFAQHVRRIKPQSVYAEFLNPHFYRTEQMFPHGAVIDVEFY